MKHTRFEAREEKLIDVSCNIENSNISHINFSNLKSDEENK